MTNRMKIFKYILLGLLGLLSIALFYIQITPIPKKIIESEEQALSDSLNSGSSFVCIIESEKRIYHIGESPKIKVKIFNNTDSTVCLVGSVDGSEIGVRAPTCSFKIEHNFWGEQEHHIHGFCASLNPIRDEEYQMIESGNYFDPYMEIDYLGYWSPSMLEWDRFLKPGIYKFRFIYSTKVEGFGSLGHKSDIIPKIELISNELTLKYKII
jgi:hypothetical protein